MTTPENSWMISETDFPSAASLEDQLRFLVGYATLAPSGHNTQPWLFATGPDWLDVLADRTRGLPVVDPYDRELAISCGAAIGVFEVAARRFALQPEVTLVPDDSNLDHLARISVLAGEPPTGPEHALFGAIKDRRTDRSAYFMESLPEDLMPACQEAVREFGISMRVFADGKAIEYIADLVAEGDHIQFEDPSFRRELACWVRSHRFGSRDGMSGRGFGMPDILAPAARFAIRTFDLGDNVAASDRQKILGGSPALALLMSEADDVENWLNTGRALAKMLLLLTARGFTASYLNQPIEIEALRLSMQEAVGVNAIPQILLRVGRSENSPAPSARRELSDVLVTN